MHTSPLPPLNNSQIHPPRTHNNILNMTTSAVSDVIDSSLMRAEMADLASGLILAIAFMAFTRTDGLLLCNLLMSHLIFINLPRFARYLNAVTMPVPTAIASVSAGYAEARSLNEYAIE